MSGMTWQPQFEGQDNGSWCEMSIREDVPKSELKTFLEPAGTWSWEASLYASPHEHFATGYGCATEGKARFMAMSAVSALLQIIDGVKPHDVD